MFLVWCSLLLFVLNTEKVWWPVVVSLSTASTNMDLQSYFIKPQDDIVAFTDLTPCRIYNITPQEPVQLFQFAGKNVSALYLWSTVEVVINFTAAVDENFGFIQDTNSSTVRLAAENEVRRFWGILKPLNVFRTTRLAPFPRTFFAVITNEPYLISLKLTAINYKLMALFVVGLIMFFNAKRLARNSAFYYSTGISVGVVGSVLLVFFLLSRFLPRRWLGVSVLFGGWSFGFYAIYYAWLNFTQILQEHYTYVAIYAVTLAFISFAVLYWFGPPSQRSLNLSQWALQLIGLGCVFFGSQIQELNVAVIVSALVVYNIPEARIARCLKKVWYRLFSAKRRFLTEEEYQQQGVEYTRKALEELRSFCQSPECSPWKTMSRLRTPLRFADFVEGGSHLTDDEILGYETDEMEVPFRDDDDPFDNLEEEPADDDLSQYAGSSQQQHANSWTASSLRRTERIGNRTFDGFSSRFASNLRSPGAWRSSRRAAADDNSDDVAPRALSSSQGFFARAVAGSANESMAKHRMNSLPVESQRRSGGFASFFGRASNSVVSPDKAAPASTPSAAAKNVDVETDESITDDEDHFD